MVMDGGYELESIIDQGVTDIDSEVESFEKALSSTKQDLQKMQQNMEGIIPDSDKALFDAYVRMLWWSGDRFSVTSPTTRR